MDENAPLPYSTQWPEARNFQRLYADNPMYQARFVMTLLGFRQDLLEWTDDSDTIEAIDLVISTFHKRHPEFTQDGYMPDTETGLGPYHLDDRLKSILEEIGCTATERNQ
jgi:hypothetical protein